MPYNLLTEPMITCRLAGDGVRRFTLPGVLAHLSRSEILSYEALLPFQEASWHSLCVQIAALALLRSQKPDLPTDESDWRTLLLALSEGANEPWTLVVENLALPAFLQMPVVTGDIAPYKKIFSYPDEMDVLILAKNHDVKAGRFAHPTAEHWLMALVSCQTTQGFSGRGNYGISRMNGGFGNRPHAAATPALGWGTRFRHDLAVLRSHHANTAKERGFTPGGLALLWLSAWDGTSSLDRSTLDPWYVESCRRIRLVQEGGAIHARFASTTAPRVPVEAAPTGDPWAPIDKSKDEVRTLTVGPAGIDCRLVRRLIAKDEMIQPPCLESGVDGSYFIVFSALVRGQGKTEGYHERVVQVPQKARRLMIDPSEGREFRERSAAFLEITDTMRTKVLLPSVSAAIHGDSADSKDKSPLRWTAAFQRSVDSCFFEQLWGSAAEERNVACTRWVKHLKDLAHVQLEDALQSASIPSGRYWRQVAAADGLFGALLHKQFADWLTPRTPTT